MEDVFDEFPPVNFFLFLANLLFEIGRMYKGLFCFKDSKSLEIVYIYIYYIFNTDNKINLL